VVIEREKMATRIWLLTGDPGAGKSTVLSRILLAVRTRGFTVGGILTREVKRRGERTGFVMVDLATEESEILADLEGLGPRIGRYRVNLNSLSGLSVKALEYAKNASDLVACDEVGPMELLSPDFRRAVRASILETKKPAICIVHKRYSDPLIDELKSSVDAKEFEITIENRETISSEIQKDIIRFLSGSTATK
jgi:nucleoside-triphosphatase